MAITLTENAAKKIQARLVKNGIADLPVRVKCAILLWHTLQSAFNAIDNTSPRRNMIRCT